jgi:hypothetical protein
METSKLNESIKTELFQKCINECLACAVECERCATGGMGCGGLNNFRTSRSEKKLNHSNIH